MYDRHRRWSADGTGQRILRAVQAGADAEGRIDWSMASVDSTVCRAHQQQLAPSVGLLASRVGARERTGTGMTRLWDVPGRAHHEDPLGGWGWSAAAELVDHAGQWGDASQMIPVLERVRVPRVGGGHPRTRPDHLGGDKAYPSRRNRRYLRRRQIAHMIPEPDNQRANRRRRGSAGGRPTGFDPARYVRRNEVERLIGKLKTHRAVAMRFDKRAFVFEGTVSVAAIRLWLRS